MDPGKYSFGLRVDDASGQASSGIFELSFLDRLVISTARIADFTVGASTDSIFLGSGGAPPYEWELSDGILPEGITIDQEGILSGVPTVAGISEFVLALTDSTDSVVKKNFSLNVVENLILATQSIPAAVNGENYSFEFTASGGSKPYTWSLSSEAVNSKE